MKIYESIKRGVKDLGERARIGVPKMIERGRERGVEMRKKLREVKGVPLKRKTMSGARAGVRVAPRKGLRKGVSDRVIREREQYRKNMNESMRRSSNIGKGVGY